MELTPGTVLGHYEVVGPAEDSPRPSRFLIRERTRRTMHEVEIVERLDTDTRTRLLNEAASQTRLHHANVLAITEVLELDRAIGLVTAHVEGIPFSEVLQEGEPLARPDALRLFGQMCDAMVAAHAAGVLHRELDPDAILVVIDGERADARVTRFGRAALQRERAPSLTSAGYTAPEILREPRAQDPRADVFSLGAILYELLCGHPAFRQADSRKAAEAILQGRFAPIGDRLPGFPASGVAVVHKALAKDPNARFATVRDLQRAVGGASAALLAPPLRRAGPGESTHDFPPEPSEDTTGARKPGVVVGRGAGRAPVAKVRFDAPMAPMPGTTPMAPMPGQFEEDGGEEKTQVVPSARLASTAPPPRSLEPVREPVRVEPPLRPAEPVRSADPVRTAEPVRAVSPEPVRAAEPARPPEPSAANSEKAEKPPEKKPKEQQAEGPSLIGRLLPVFLVLFVFASIGGTIWALASGAAGRMTTAQDGLRSAGDAQAAAWTEVSPTLATVTSAAHDSVSLTRAVEAYRDANSPADRVDAGESAFRELQREASRQGGGNPTPQVGAALERVLEANKAYGAAFTAAVAAEEGLGADLALSMGLVAGRAQTVHPPTLLALPTVAQAPTP